MPKRKRSTAAKLQPEVSVLPHGLGAESEAVNVNGEKHSASNTILPSSSKAKPTIKDEPTLDAIHGKETASASKSPKKKIKYGVELGVTPYPDLARPTAEECYEVDRLLSKLHGKVKAPENIPVPSRTVAGCGQVKFILEALVRTHLSAHTSAKNANAAIQGLHKRFPTIQNGLCAGSMDWNNIRLEPREDLEQAIRHGGMAPTKSKAIKAILEMVYEENKIRRKQLIEDEQRDAEPIKAEIKSEDTTGTDRASILAKFADEVLREDSNTLTLDYMHAMSASEAFMKFLTFPGIGVKTAACTLLFCMQRPCFAVDTHVYRLCKWLGWVPPNATRDTTFAHCDVRIPNELKYSLHQLLISHGKRCGKCRAITGENSSAWDEECPLEHLIKRTGAKKGGMVDSSPSKRKKTAKTTRNDEDSDEDTTEGGSDNGEGSGEEYTPKRRRTTANGQLNGTSTKRHRSPRTKPTPPTGKAGSTASKKSTKAGKMRGPKSSSSDGSRPPAKSPASDRSRRVSARQAVRVR